MVRTSNICYYNNQEYNFTKPYSEKTAEKIDEEVKRLINEQYERAKSILRENADKHARLAAILIDREVIYAEDVEKIFGKRPWKSRTEVLLEEEAASKEKEEARRRAEAERMAGVAPTTPPPPIPELPAEAEAPATNDKEEKA